MAGVPAWRRGWRSRTPPGVRRHRRRTGVKESKLSIRSEPPSGRESEPGWLICRAGSRCARWDRETGCRTRIRCRPPPRSRCSTGCPGPGGAGWADLPGRISLREGGPRDGLQNEDPVPTAAKIALIDRLSGTGVGRIEAVSFVRPEAIPQMADADEVWQGIARTASVRYSALAANLRGARRALDAGLSELEVVVSASETHNRQKVNRGE